MPNAAMKNKNTWKKTGIEKMRYAYGTGGAAEAEAEVFTREEALQILQDIKDGKRDDIPRIEVTAEKESKKLTHDEAMKILQDIKDGKRDDIPRIIVYGERIKKQEGGEAIEDQMGDLMMMPEEEQVMVPDEQMENDYTDFIIGESLTPEDEEYLLTALEQDDRLSMIFDQVVDTASEFSGSGPVEGPGSGVSDSIPARLSDGEFVLTSKATEEIGPDKLQGMMEQAEQDADVRQMRQEGGYIQEEEEEDTNIEMASQAKVAGQRLIGDQLQDRENQKNMMMLNPRNTLLARRP